MMEDQSTGAQSILESKGYEECEQGNKKSSSKHAAMSKEPDLPDNQGPQDFSSVLGENAFHRESVRKRNR